MVRGSDRMTGLRDFWRRVINGGTYLLSECFIIDRMLIQFKDYNSANEVIFQNYQTEWDELLSTLNEMSLHLKASDQQGKQGSPIFDPVGTNAHIKEHLSQKGWKNTIPLGKELDFLGTDIDFWKNGIVLEAQFSNYPFLLNNIIRSEVLFKSNFKVDGRSTKILIVVTKARIFPASNITLYYEQAIGQVDFLNRLDIFEIPVRLIGLFENLGVSIPSKWSTYKNPRYSRDPVNRKDVECSIILPKNHTRGKIKIEENQTRIE